MAVSTKKLLLTLTIVCILGLINATKPRKGGEPVEEETDPPDRPKPTEKPDPRPDGEGMDEMDREDMFEFMDLMLDDVIEHGVKGVSVMRMHQKDGVSYVKEYMVDTTLTMFSPHMMRMMKNMTNMTDMDRMDMKNKTDGMYMMDMEDEAYMMDMMDTMDMMNIMNRNKSMMSPEDRIRAVARGMGIATPEQFATDVCRSHMETYYPIYKCKAFVHEFPWKRGDVMGAPQDHTFVKVAAGIRFAEIQHEKYGSPKLVSGFQDVRILKTMPSRMRDGMPGMGMDGDGRMPGMGMDGDGRMPEMGMDDDSGMGYNRSKMANGVLSFTFSLKWLYSRNATMRVLHNSSYIDHVWWAVHNLTTKLLSRPSNMTMMGNMDMMDNKTMMDNRTMMDDMEDSLQEAGYMVVGHILKYFPMIEHAQIEMYDHHYYLPDMSKLGDENNGEVFSRIDRPQGFIRAALKRKSMEDYM